jgi:dynein heavy chain
MYQNSLQYVKALFNKAIDNSPAAETLEERLENIIDTVTKLIYTNIARGLFEKDKLVYSFLLATSIRRQAGIIEAPSWNHLLRGAMPFTKAQVEMQPENPASALMNVNNYGLMYSLEINESEVFAGLTESIRDNLDKWTEWAKCDKPHVIAMPCGW